MTTCCDDYLPDTASALLLKCHHCFSMVEVEDPTAGLIYICDMCHADLEIADVEHGYTRPPPPPATAVIGHHAPTGVFDTAGPGTASHAGFPTLAPTTSTILSGRFASSATLFRKGLPPPPASAGLPVASPAGPPPAAAPRLPALEIPARPPAQAEMELEPTTAPHPDRSLLRRMTRRLLRLLTRPWRDPSRQGPPPA